MKVELMGDFTEVADMTFTPVLLTAADAPAMVALQQEMLDALPSSRWYFPSSVEEYAAKAEAGFALGIQEEGRLVALNVVVPAGMDDHSYAELLGADEARTTDFQDIIVAPSHRRRGIHSFFLALREQEARDMGMTAIYATVDPENEPSLRAFAKAGYVLVGQQAAYDGRPRCFLRLGLEE